MLKSPKRILLALVLLQQVFCVNAQHQSGSDKMLRYSSKALQEDYAILRKALETTYPSLYRFTDSTLLTKYFEDQFRLLNKPQTEVEFYKLIATSCARVNDEHLIPTPSDRYYVALKSAMHYFPFSLKIIGRRFYVLAAAKSESSIPVGSEILSINGLPVEEILNRLLPTIPSDGYIQTFNIRHLEDYSMTQNENLFDLNYPIFVERANSFRIEYVNPTDRSRSEITTISGLDYKSYRTFYQSRIRYEAPLEFKWLKEGTAYLRISSFLKWHRDEFKQDFYSLYDSIFKELNAKQTENLILDLRNNEGGDGTGEKLLTYLLTKPYRHFESTEEKFTGYPAVVKYLENGKDLFFPDSIVYRTVAGTYRLRKEYYNYIPLLNEQQPSEKHYRGNLYVLINGASGSMASVVSSILKGNKRAIFIGEESGGAMEGNTSLAYARLILPNSKIRIQIPLTKTTHAVTFTKGRGVFPDYYVTPEMDDIVKNIDTELNFALDLTLSKVSTTAAHRGEK